MKFVGSRAEGERPQEQDVESKRKENVVGGIAAYFMESRMFETFFCLLFSLGKPVFFDLAPQGNWTDLERLGGFTPMATGGPEGFRDEIFFHH